MSRSKYKSKYKSKSDSESESKSDPRQSIILVVWALGMTFAISVLHIAYAKGRSWFLIPYIVVFLAIAAAVATLVWPRSVSAQDAGVSTDSGVSAQDSGAALGKQVEDTVFAPYPDESVDAGVCEVPK